MDSDLLACFQIGVRLNSAAVAGQGLDRFDLGIGDLPYYGEDIGGFQEGEGVLRVYAGE